jgi:L-aminopeptidase/D-esterase-like protein
MSIEGLQIGHFTGEATGVTVILVPAGTVGSGEVRGGAPATREFALLDPTLTVTRVDAVVLTGGSAFGLAAADGVMRFLAERGQGYETGAGPVPIVPAAAIFDLVESGGATPSADDGYAAAVVAASGAALTRGRVGAGRSATVGKWLGPEHAVAGGFGFAATEVDDVHLVAVAVVNAVGDIVDREGRVLAGPRAGSRGGEAGDGFPSPVFGDDMRSNTTLVVVATDARLDKLECHLVAQSAHDGMARAIRPSHTRFDGDLTIALATGGIAAVDDVRHAHADNVTDNVADRVIDRIRMAACDATEAAIRDAVAGSLDAGSEGS